MSSTDRTEQYPEISGEESGLVPSMKAEWPKKIRTLTATELDRLTIDGDGRFYWDGHLVNYRGPNDPDVRSNDARDAGALDLLDRAALEITGRAPPPGDAETPVTNENTDLSAALNAAGIGPMENRPADATLTEVSLAGSNNPMPAGPPMVHLQSPDYPMLIAPTVHGPEKFRVSLSVWQSIGAVILTLGLLAAAAGVAAQGFVAANEWGCRIGVVKAYCPPPPPAPKAPARTDIPA